MSRSLDTCVSQRRVVLRSSGQKRSLGHIHKLSAMNQTDLEREDGIKTGGSEETGGKDEWMDGRLQEEKAGRKAPLFYLGGF